MAVSVGDAPMLVLVCGLPGAGKSTLVRALVEASTSEQVREWVAFDDLFERFGGYASTFNPAEWKKCQIEMVSRVQSRLMHWKETSSRETSVRCRNQVLFVDDNFQYRSQRKRFFHLACQLDAGFGILFLNTPVSTCQARNNDRRIGDASDINASAYIPEDVMARMVAIFEPPDPERVPFESNTRELSSAFPSDVIEQASQALRSMAKDSTNAMTVHHMRKEEANRQHEQQTKDRANVRQNVAHLVDLELRRWISTELQALGCQDKPQRAQTLNKHRKDFLAQLKTSQLTIGDGTNADTPLNGLDLLSIMATNSNDIHELVDALIQHFRSQYAQGEANTH